MSSLLESLVGNLSGDNLAQISRQLDADEDTTKNALGAALPMMLGALSRNVQQPGGAEALQKAIERDHDGSILDQLGSVIGQGESAEGDRIASHLFGEKKTSIEDGVSKASGLNSGSTAKLFAILGPIVLGALGKQVRSRGLDSGGLAGYLGQEREAAQRAAPEQVTLLGRFFDQDGDGDFDTGDVARLGISMIGKMLTGRK